MFRYQNLLIVSVTALALAGCGLIPDNSLRYREAQVLEPMEVPEEWVFTGEEPLYAVPDMDRRLTDREDGEDKFRAPTPPRLVSAPDADEDEETDDESTGPVREPRGQAILGKDGSGYPIIMIPTRFAWAWEQVADALVQTDLRVTDRNRDQGVFLLTTPEDYRLEPPRAQLKLSHTTNGIQVAVLNGEGTSLADKESSLAILESIHREL